MNVCILIPTLGEAKEFISASQMRQNGAASFAHESRGVRVALHICGMGVDNARRQTEIVLDQGTDCLILAGYCGGLQKNLRLGDVVIDTQDPDPDFTGAVMRIAGARKLVVHQSAIFTSPRLLATPAEKMRAGVQTGALAVDMEGSGVLECCRARKLPFRSFRTVSDNVTQRLPGALKHITLDGKAPLRFWCALACRFWEWPDVCRMLLTGKLATKNLATVLVDWVNELMENETPRQVQAGP